MKTFTIKTDYYIAMSMQPQATMSSSTLSSSFGVTGTRAHIVIVTVFVAVHSMLHFHLQSTPFTDALRYHKLELYELVLLQKNDNCTYHVITDEITFHGCFQQPRGTLARTFANSFSKLLEGMMIKASYLADIVIETAKEETCDADCGLKPNNNISLDMEVSNGCKFFGIPIPNDDLPTIELLKCCNDMESCYKQCGRAKLTCDSEFLECLDTVCLEQFANNSDKLIACNLGTKVLMIGNLAFGCKSFKGLQARYCCHPMNI
ncbi:Group XIIA secretory phospholipase A2 [Fragariocoptes setiger]|uniref:Group XIIA secretory phospholipase A2 n=1 Tax=Fragariocoptes setiger TaxID=1670756 RepID=A0ABQ7S8Y5_9ACAR|nr:Group XIIA secretory phospholipase A2 [Fragariocoptes setiger]